MSIFLKIINREIPAYIVAENDRFIAFLDINPLKMGHTLVVPKKEVEYIFDLDNNHLADLMVFSKNVAKGIKKAFPCKKVGIAVIGLEVPHTHIHLIPLDEVEDINFSKPKLQPSKEDLAIAAEKIILSINY